MRDSRETELLGNLNSSVSFSPSFPPVFLLLLCSNLSWVLSCLLRCWILAWSYKLHSPFIKSMTLCPSSVRDKMLWTNEVISAWRTYVCHISAHRGANLYLLQAVTTHKADLHCVSIQRGVHLCLLPLSLCWMENYSLRNKTELSVFWCEKVPAGTCVLSFNLLQTFFHKGPKANV